MRCPRCQSETGHDGDRCSACGAPLSLGEERAPGPLDRPLDLDRRGLPDAPPGPHLPAPAPPPRPPPVRSPAPAPARGGGPLRAEPPGVLELHRAGSGRRAAAWAIDGLPFALAGLALLSWLGAGDARLVAPLVAVIGLASFTYQALLHSLLGATLGQRLLGLRVVDLDGQRPGPGRSALRAAAAVLGVLALGLGPLTALFTRSGRGLHDLVAGTVVVDAVRRAPVSRA